MRFLLNTTRWVTKSRLLMLFVFLTFCIRLVLGGDRDILAINEPYDDYWFVSSALRFIYGGDYNNLVFAQLPTYAMWLKGWSLLGIPARLAIDVAWLISVAYLGFAVARLVRSVWPGIVIYIFLAFHPYSFVLFDRAFSENLMVVLSALAAAGFIDLWNLRDAPRICDWRRSWAVSVTALAFAGAYHTRKEGVVLLAVLLVFVIFSLVNRDVFWRGEQRYRLGYPLLIAPLVAVLILGVALAGANYLRWGVFARYELAAPGYTRAMNALIAIDPAGSTPKHVTITALTRTRAYAQSPTFAELKPFLDGPMGQAVARFTEPYGAPGEIANGWFYWTFRDAAAAAGWHVDAVNAERKYDTMAQELESAFDSGKMPRRRVILPFVDPDWAKWLQDLPSSLVGTVRQTVDPTVANLNLINSSTENASAIVYDQYVTLVGRRSPRISFTIEGWVTLPEGTWIGLGTNEMVYSWQVLEGAIRPDVPGAISFVLSSTNGAIPTELWVRQLNGKKSHFFLRNLREGAVQDVPDIQGALIGFRVMKDTIKHRADSFISPTTKVWAWFGWMLFFAGFLALWFPRGGGKGNQSAISLVAAFMLFAMFSRVFLLAILDASSWNGQQTRYLLPALPFFAVFGILGIWSALQWVVPLRRNIK